jgi:RNA polymerase sigma factor (TIGR02999 family)
MMTGASSHQITQLLLAWGEGDQTALDKLLPLVYDELKRLARRYMHRESPGHLLQTTALVNEAYIRLIDAHQVQWQNRAHFFAISARLMRRILVDFARRSHKLKRGGKAKEVSLADTVVLSDGRTADLEAIDDALTALAALDERQSQVVELRFFGGLKDNEIAEVLKVSHGTVRRDWRLARAWLHRELSKQ